MASVNRKFAVEKGLEVGTDALVVDADNIAEVLSLLI